MHHSSRSRPPRVQLPIFLALGGLLLFPLSTPQTGRWIRGLRARVGKALAENSTTRPTSVGAAVPVDRPRAEDRSTAEPNRPRRWYDHVNAWLRDRFDRSPREESVPIPGAGPSARPMMSRMLCFGRLPSAAESGLSLPPRG